MANACHSERWSERGEERRFSRARIAFWHPTRLRAHRDGQHAIVGPQKSLDALGALRPARALQQPAGPAPTRRELLEAAEPDEDESDKPPGQPRRLKVISRIIIWSLCSGRTAAFLHSSPATAPSVKGNPDASETQEHHGAWFRDNP
jgi:hypothetical protein